MQSFQLYFLSLGSISAKHDVGFIELFRKGTHRCTHEMYTPSSIDKLFYTTGAHICVYAYMFVSVLKP